MSSRSAGAPGPSTSTDTPPRSQTRRNRFAPQSAQQPAASTNHPPQARHVRRAAGATSRQTPSAHQLPAVDVERLPRDAGREIRRKEDHGSRDLVGVGDPAKRNLPRDLRVGARTGSVRLSGNSTPASENTRSAVQLGPGSDLARPKSITFTTRSSSCGRKARIRSLSDRLSRHPSDTTSRLTPPLRSRRDRTRRGSFRSRVRS